MSVAFDFTRPDALTQNIYEKGVYPPQFNDEFKEYIRHRDGYKCALCEEKKPLDVHHLNYTKYTVKINCISLCRDCHQKVHAHSYERHTWAEKFYRITRLRENVFTPVQIAMAWRLPDAT